MKAAILSAFLLFSFSIQATGHSALPRDLAGEWIFEYSQCSDGSSFFGPDNQVNQFSFTQLSDEELHKQDYRYQGDISRYSHKGNGLYKVTPIGSTVQSWNHERLEIEDGKLKFISVDENGNVNSKACGHGLNWHSVWRRLSKEVS